MAINKKLIHFKTFENFNSQKLSANEANTKYTTGISGTETSGNPDILYQSICFIKDTQQIWTHGQIYNASADNSLRDANVQAVDIAGGLDDVAEPSIGGGGTYAEVNHGTSDSTFELTPNTFHVWDEVTSLNLTLGAETSGIANEYLFQFASGSTPTTLTLPDGIKFSEDLTIEANKIYQISILKGLGSVLSWDSVTLIDNYLRKDGSNLVFDYPVASDVVVSVYGRPTSAAASSVPTSFTLEYTTGSQSMSVRSVFNIEGITPPSDDAYNYISDSI